MSNPQASANRVLFRRSSYDYRVLRPVLFEIMDELGGRRIGRNASVLIKPNFLAPARPEEAILTHPHVIRVVAEYLLERGARPTVSDSPAVGSFKTVLTENGVLQALEGLDVKCQPFRECVRRDIGPPFGEIEMARDIFESDFVINLPKLKTHESLLMTLGVKNLFGCIVGLRKPDWHFRTGIDRDFFATLLVLVHNAVRPFMTILDGILALEGEGPGRPGIPRELGCLAASRNALALDAAVCRMIGLDPDSVYTCRAAARMGFSPVGPLDIDGEMPAVSGFKLPHIIPLVFGPKPLHGLIRKYLTRKPAVIESACILCGQCLQICPAKAVKKGNRAVTFDYETCIRCFCCMEVCPEGALKPAGLWGEKIARAYLKLRRQKTGLQDEL